MKNNNLEFWISHARNGSELVRWIGVLGITFLIMGCAFVRGEVGEPFSEDRVKALEKGKTTRQEVAFHFGAPDEVVEANGYEIFHYRRFDSKLGWVLFFSRLNVGSDNLWVFLNSKGIVEEVVFGKHTGNLKFQVWPFGD